MVSLSGLIDFYFAATDLLAYDLAVCLNAWCFEPDRAIQRHQGPRHAAAPTPRIRPLSAAPSSAALPCAVPRVRRSASC